MGKAEENYTNVLLEDIREQMKAVLEISVDTRNLVSHLPTRDEFNELKEDVAAIKLAVKHTNEEQKLHDRRITRLEEKAA